MKLLSCILCFVFMFTTSHAKDFVERYDETIIRIGEQNFQTELALTKEERSKGLMYRPSIKPNQAMLFINNSPKRVGFWMKNTKIYLDMLFFDSEGILVEVKSNIAPCLQVKCQVYYSKSDQIKAVLEIKGGEANRRNIQIGEKLKGYDL